MTHRMQCISLQPLGIVPRLQGISLPALGLDTHLHDVSLESFELILCACGLVAGVHHIRPQLLLFIRGDCGVRPVFLRIGHGAFGLNADALDVSGQPRDLGARSFDFFVGTPACNVDLLLRLATQFLEAFAKLADLHFGRPLQIVAMLLRGRANLNELALGFLTNLGRHFLRRGGNGALLILGRRAHDLLRKIVQLGFEVLTQVGRRAVERRAKLIVERH